MSSHNPSSIGDLACHEDLCTGLEEGAVHSSGAELVDIFNEAWTSLSSAKEHCTRPLATLTARSRPVQQGSWSEFHLESVVSRSVPVRSRGGTGLVNLLDEF